MTDMDYLRCPLCDHQARINEESFCGSRHWGGVPKKDLSIIWGPAFSNGLERAAHMVIFHKWGPPGSLKRYIGANPSFSRSFWP